MGGSKQKSGPTASGKLAQGALTSYLLGPGAVDALQGAGTQQAGAELGLGGGILPSYQDLQNTANQSFFGSGGQSGNPIFDQALGTIFSTPEIEMPSLDFSGISLGGGYGGGGGAPSGFGSNLIGQDSINNAIGKLENPDSVFDVMSGGPIVDTINNRVNELDTAYTDRAMADLDTALEIGLAQNAANGGFVSSSAVLEQRGRVTENVLNDLNVFRATQNLEATKYLGDLAMRDVINGTNAAQALLQQAMVEKGINADYAAAIAAVNAQQATAIATAQIAAQAQLANTALSGQYSLAANQQDNALNLLGLGVNDFQNTQQNQLNVGQLPLTMLGGLATGTNTGTTSTKSI